MIIQHALFRLPALLEQYPPGLVVIKLGGNDGLRGYPIQSLRENLATIAELSQAKLLANFLPTLKKVLP